MKWFTCLSGPLVPGYWDCLRVALATAPPDLEPHFIYDGPDCPELGWVSRRAVVHRHRLSFADRLPPSLGLRGQFGIGAFLRCDVPLFCDDAFALYTDVDVMFTGMSLHLETVRPALLAAAPEFAPDAWEYFNSGVMVLNVAAFRERADSIIESAIALGFAGLDQGALNRWAGGKWDRLEPTYNWKPYWGVNPEARIIHFHGPKPGGRGSPIEIPGNVAPLRRRGFDYYESCWEVIRGREE